MTEFASDAKLDIVPEPKAPPKSARRRAREFVLQGLYQWRVGGANEATVEAHVAELEGFAKADREFFVGTLRGVIAQNEKLAEQIGSHIDRPFAELSPIEANVLLMGSFELIHYVETPYRVIINECIELTKAFGGTDGHKYVNGVLDKVAAAARPEFVARNKR